MTTTLSGPYAGAAGENGAPSKGGYDSYSYGWIYGHAGINAGGGLSAYAFSAGGSLQVTASGSATGGAGGAGGVGKYGYSGGSGGVGGVGLLATATGTIANAGTIRGGAGGAGGVGYGPTGSSPGLFAFLYGYDGGTAGNGAKGGAGLVAYASAPIAATNTGAIYGGSGGAGGKQFGYSTAGYGGAGGAGAMIAGSLINSGRIVGGNGGPGGLYATKTGGGAWGAAGAGVYLLAGGSVTNSGYISGGFGATALVAGDGVFLQSGGKLVNMASGVIRGSYGVLVGPSSAAVIVNYGTIYGSIQSVRLDAASRLVLEPGSRLQSYGGPYMARLPAFGGSGTLEIAGGTSTLSGLGTTASSGSGLTGSITASFTGFGTYLVDAGASVALAGAQSLSASKALKVSGTVTSLAGSTFANSGKIKVSTGGSLALAAIDNTGELKVAGGKLVLSGDVTGAGKLVITSGKAKASSSFTEDVHFNGVSGKLVLKDSQAYGGTISGFSTSGGESLDLKDIGFVSAGEASFSGTASGGTLTVTDGTHTAHIALSGDYLGSKFVASSDGKGGTIIVDPPAPPAAASFIDQMAGVGGGAHSGYTGVGAYGRLPPRQPVLAAARAGIA